VEKESKIFKNFLAEYIKFLPESLKKTYQVKFFQNLLVEHILGC